ncbi:MAG: hypothetical protein KBD00_05150 [Candidatus Peribacteraceae bacterium]|nr:hypothetical protein [Candidatus Peribacteraceae bacterium]
MFASDDDIDLPLSSSKQFTSADKGRRDRLEQKLHQKVDRQDLHKLKLSVLKQQMEGKKDDATKKMREEEGNRRFKPPVTFGTKTHEQEAKAAQLDADVKINVDQMVESGKTAQAAKQEQQKSGEVQSQPS